MKQNNWVSSSQASEMLTKQLATWPLAQKNFAALKDIKLKVYDLGGFEVKVQYTPSRTLSAGAKVDPLSIIKRKCFLCQNNLPLEQERLPFGTDYLVLCNPYPIFPEHFTIPVRSHIDQLITGRYKDMLEMAKRMDRFTIFYNGPKSGASAPDHMHFQAVNRYVMPLDNEIDMLLETKSELIREYKDGNIFAIKDYLRNGFILKAKEKETAEMLFRTLYSALPIKDDDIEPKMNIFCLFRNKEWITIVIPRSQHRPKQFDEEGDKRILSSPGAADIGGLYVASREEDFEKINPEILRDIYTQVCLNDQQIEEISNRIR